jgi:hypothetical protein
LDPPALQQRHGYDPGISRGDLFWVARVPDESVRVDLDRGRATFRVRNFDIPDWTTNENSIKDGKLYGSEPAEVTLDVRWGDVQDRYRLRDVEQGFAGQFVETRATIEWSARQDGFEFSSESVIPDTDDFFLLGHERNGVFFRGV